MVIENIPPLRCFVSIRLTMELSRFGDLVLNNPSFDQKRTFLAVVNKHRFLSRRKAAISPSVVYFESYDRL